MAFLKGEIILENYPKKDFFGFENRQMTAKIDYTWPAALFGLSNDLMHNTTLQPNSIEAKNIDEQLRTKP